MQTNLSAIALFPSRLQWRTVAQWGLLTFSVLCAAGSSILWRLQHSDEQAEVKQVMDVLEDIYRRESTYLQNNMTYSPGFAQLGLDTPEVANWKFSIVTARGGKRPLLLIEASNGQTRIAMDEQRAIFTSSPAEMVAVPIWKPPAPTPPPHKQQAPTSEQAPGMTSQLDQQEQPSSSASSPG